jgi:hypothetical protein
MDEQPNDDKRPELLRLLEELDRLAEEQRTVDLHDPAALLEIEHQIAALRYRITLLEHSS